LLEDSELVNYLFFFEKKGNFIRILEWLSEKHNTQTWINKLIK